MNPKIPLNFRMCRCITNVGKRLHGEYGEALYLWFVTEAGREYGDALSLVYHRSRPRIRRRVVSLVCHRSRPRIRRPVASLVCLRSRRMKSISIVSRCAAVRKELKKKQSCDKFLNYHQQPYVSNLDHSRGWAVVVPRIRRRGVCVTPEVIWESVSIVSWRAVTEKSCTTFKRKRRWKP